MSEEVLVRWADLIAFAKAHVGTRSMEDPARCIIDLAAALRDERVCADTECRDLHIRELQARVAELETRLAESETQRMTDYDDTLLGREMREKESRGIA